jgi:6-phosphogluconolactonase (cycloisomerase 2 family)
MENNSASIFAYVGAYTTQSLNGHGEGLTVFRLDPATGGWQPIQALKEGAADASFLALDRSNRFLYAVNEGQEEVSAFALEPGSGQLTWLNTQPTGGSTPASLSVAPDGRFVIVANYFGGNVAVLPVGDKGQLGPVSQLITLEGQTGPDKVEQSQSHPHDVCFDPTGQYVLVPDKGFDRVFIYNYAADTGRLTPADPPFVTVEAGAGPRHLVFHPNGRFAYLINELGSSISVFSYAANPLALEELQVVCTLPVSFSGTNTCAEIAVAPSGKFVYGSNRGHDSIVVFAVDPDNGQLSPLQWQATGGKTPRFFMLDAPGERLYAANQDSDTITIFEVNRQAGLLSPTGQVVPTGSPVCIVERRT